MRPYTIPLVMKANVNGRGVVRNDLVTPVEAKFVRLVVGCDLDAATLRAGPALRLELHFNATAPSPPARWTRWTEKVPVGLVDWAAPIDVAGHPKTRADAAREEIQLLRRIPVLEAQLQRWAAGADNPVVSSLPHGGAGTAAPPPTMHGGAVGLAPGAVVPVVQGPAHARRLAAELAEKYRQWEALLRRIGSERRGDLVAVVTPRVAAMAPVMYKAQSEGQWARHSMSLPPEAGFV